MHPLRYLLGWIALASLAAAQELPQAVELLQRLDQLYPKFTARSLAVDLQGNIYVTGGVFIPLSAGVVQAGLAPKIGIIPLSCPEGTPDPLPDFVTIRIGPLGCSDVIVLKFDPSGQQVIYGTAVGGTTDDTGTNIRVDAGGNVYVGGTASANFPAISFQGTAAGVFVLKLDSSGHVIYNTVLGWVGPYEAGQTHPFDVDATGAVYFGGSVTSGKLPATPSAYRSAPKSPPTTEGFVAKLSPAGTVQNATYMDDTVGQLLIRPGGEILLSSASTVAELDSSLSQRIFLTPIKVSPGVGITSLGVDTIGNIYVADTQSRWKYAPDGQHLLAVYTFPSGLFTFSATTRSGTTYFSGRVPLDFPTFNGTQPCELNLQQKPLTPNNYLMAAVEADGSLKYATYFAARAETAFTPSLDDRLYILASQMGMLTDGEGVLRIDPAAFPTAHASAGCLAHSVTLQSSAIAPGTRMTLFGDHLGPAAGESFTMQPSGAPFELAGTSITVDGMPSSILYAQDHQLTFVAPWSLRTDGARVPICVTANAESSCLYAATLPNSAAFYSLNGQIAAINQDETINSPDHPAHAGSYVSLYFTGGGKLEGSPIDGGIAGFQLQPIVNANITSSFYYSPGCVQYCSTEVLFAGAVPTLLYGKDVVIVRVPETAPANGHATVTVRILTFGKNSYLSTMTGTLSVAP